MRFTTYDRRTAATRRHTMAGSSGAVGRSEQSSQGELRATVGKEAPKHPNRELLACLRRAWAHHMALALDFVAEAERLVDLTGSEQSLLAGLAKGPAVGYRTTKSKLMRSIPELDPFVDSLGAASSETESKYVLSSVVAARIDVTPRG